MAPTPENPFLQPTAQTPGGFAFLEEDALEDAPSGSLSAFIAERLKNRGPESTQPTEEAEPSPPELFISKNKSAPPEAPSLLKSKGPTGMVLRHLDSQLVNAHLEQYLPTASTRYYLMRERVQAELEALDAELLHLKKLNVLEDAAKIATLEDRVTFLREKLKGLDITLSEMNPFQGVYHWVQQLRKTTPVAKKSRRTLWSWIPNKTRAMTDEMSAINDELQTLESILAEQLHDPCFTPDQLGQLIHNYDRYIKQTEHLVARYQAQTTMRDRLNATLARWYRRWFDWGR